MLGKVFKYDRKAMAKRLLPLYALLLIVAALTRFMMALAGQIPVFKSISGLFLVITVVGMIGSFFYTFFAGIMYFYKMVMREEGYLAHTLPIKKSTFVFSKVLVSFLFMLCTIVVVILAILILVPNYSVFTSIYEFLKEQLATAGISITWFMSYFIMMMLLGIISGILFFYCALSLGQTHSDRKLTYSIVYGLIVYMVTQAVGSIVLFGYMILNPNLSVATNVTVVQPEFFVIIGISTVLTFIYIVSYFMISVKTLEKNFNIE